MAGRCRPGPALAPVQKPRALTKPKVAGMNTRVSTVQEAMPPIMGTAMRRITSEPEPVPHSIAFTELL